VRGLAIFLAAAGVLAVIGLAALIGSRDKSGETVAAGEWAQDVCGVVGVWRGQIESIVEDIRTPGSQGAIGTEEPQSETPQGRTGFIRQGVERAVQATETMVNGIDDAGVPDSPDGEQAARTISEWANSAKAQLEDADDALDREADSLEDAMTQVADAATAIGATLASGLKTIADVAVIDPQLVPAFRDASTCEQLRENRN
jgi:hypothetical protein